MEKSDGDDGPFGEMGKYLWQTIGSIFGKEEQAVDDSNTVKNEIPTSRCKNRKRTRREASSNDLSLPSSSSSSSSGGALSSELDFGNGGGNAVTPNDDDDAFTLMMPPSARKKKRTEIVKIKIEDSSSLLSSRSRVKKELEQQFSATTSESFGSSSTSAESSSSSSSSGASSARTVAVHEEEGSAVKDEFLSPVRSAKSKATAFPSPETAAAQGLSGISSEHHARVVSSLCKNNRTVSQSLDQLFEDALPQQGFAAPQALKPSRACVEEEDPKAHHSALGSFSFESASASDSFDKSMDVDVDDGSQSDGKMDYGILGKADLVVLKDKKAWINDNIINSFFAQITDRNRNFKAFSSFFYSKLVQDGEYDFKKVQRWTRKLNYNEFSHILIPVNHTSHWMLVWIDLKKGVCRVIDSLVGGSRCDEIAENMKQWLLDEYSQGNLKQRKNFPMDWDLKVLAEAAQQNNFNDCGVFVCEFANRIVQFGSEDPLTYPVNNVSTRNCMLDVLHNRFILQQKVKDCKDSFSEAVKYFSKPQQN
eukprot:TRINITY_DN27982_c0_g1_i1.p1 TRINITY_DN27982_c0_g1~~TRINITY_DN27982_c0_g1_i1.p1  ORF type:complete len:535 (+),score=174.72 TRINITY_DN27982_c0_g1_i1:143-1747(+)